LRADRENAAITRLARALPLGKTVVIRPPERDGGALPAGEGVTLGDAPVRQTGNNLVVQSLRCVSSFVRYWCLASASRRRLLSKAPTRHGAAARRRRFRARPANDTSTPTVVSGRPPAAGAGVARDAAAAARGRGRARAPLQSHRQLRRLPVSQALTPRGRQYPRRGRGTRRLTPTQGKPAPKPASEACSRLRRRSPPEGRRQARPTPVRAPDRCPHHRARHATPQPAAGTETPRSPHRLRESRRLRDHSSEIPAVADDQDDDALAPGSAEPAPGPTATATHYTSTPATTATGTRQGTARQQQRHPRARRRFGQGGAHSDPPARSRIEEEVSSRRSTRRAHSVAVDRNRKYGTTK